MLSSVFATLKVNKDILLQRAHEGFITATELADVLVRDKGLSFRHSHKITSTIVKHMIKNGQKAQDITPQIISDISMEVLGRSIDLEPAEIEKALDPVNFINVRSVTGGPAPAETERMLRNRGAVLEKDQEFLNQYVKKLKDAELILNEAIGNIICREPMP